MPELDHVTVPCGGAATRGAELGAGGGIPFAPVMPIFVQFDLGAFNPPNEALFPSWLTGGVEGGGLRFTKVGVYYVVLNVAVHLGLRSSEDPAMGPPTGHTGAVSGGAFQWDDGELAMLQNELHYSTRDIGGGGLI